MRLIAIAEGQTEGRFLTNVLAPHLNTFIDVRLLGGCSTYGRFKKFLRLCLLDRSPEARFTTMIDYYKLPREFPGLRETEAYGSRECVAAAGAGAVR